MLHFNPRAYVRHDNWQRWIYATSKFQSTCLREARQVALNRFFSLLNFNPRAYVRHDVVESVKEGEHQFQSTCLREARLKRCNIWLISTYFNPRAYVRHDITLKGTVPEGMISIHVPT